MTCTNFPKDNLVPTVTQHQVGDVTYQYKGNEIWEAITAPLKHSQLSEPNAVGAHDEIYTRKFKSFNDMLAYSGLSDGERYSTGSTIWKYKLDGSVTISDFTPINSINVDDFGAKVYEGGDKQLNADINNVAFSSALGASWNFQIGLVSTGEHYCLSEKLTIKQLSPVDAWPFTNNQDVSFNSIIENLTDDYWLEIKSQSGKVYIKEQRGGLNTKGVFVTKQGDLYLDIGTTRGMALPVVYNDAYSHTIYPSFVTAGNTGILLNNSNAIKIIGGRVGGNFTTGDIDASTCNTGVDIQLGTANHIIGTNIEYCKNTSDSWALVDNGKSTLVTGGYYESCSGGLIKATGNDGKFDIQTLATGVYNQEGIKDTGINNRFFIQDSSTTSHPVEDTANSTLAFVYPAFSYRVNQSTKLDGNNRSLITLPNSIRWNKLRDSSTLSTAEWSLNPVAGFVGASVNYFATGFPEMGFPLCTEFTLPLQDSRDKQYAISQTGSHLFLSANTMFTAGGYFTCSVGKVDVMIKVLVGSTYFTHTFSVSATDDATAHHWEALQARLEAVSATSPSITIYLRPTEASVIKIYGLSMYEYTDVGALPPTQGAIVDEMVVGANSKDIFTNGLFLEGTIRVSPRFLPTTIVMRDFSHPLYITGVDQTLPSPADVKYKYVTFKNVGGSSITLTGSIDGAVSKILEPNEVLRLLSDGSTYLVL